MVWLQESRCVDVKRRGGDDLPYTAWSLRRHAQQCVKSIKIEHRKWVKEYENRIMKKVLS